ncbi:MULTISPECIES: AsmA-like C-terminal domain-containing protein [unclassified Sulfuricurvum]|uniref:YhdP family protein n=1 Tax=unclassified Sulfuricurvum TaxID=2632390 RepID=UPI0002997A4F|nr:MULTISPECIES: AsmA-like C-terminal domain-containing protein [unclassified Sulfuricurvum]AFV97542.1 hypothetical protein B649_06140 [Candidatus Sulfuricurvum sp. RIFRC-1]OHD90666.1 MAG: hypothetical protein A3G19_05030 [Sulfuricurvum sp. RIFCSPLOWO2_12_FULL_43_24]HBM35234.1 hypothetical protein [Sulfuricurvum sp.]
MKETIITNIIPKTHRYILFGLFFTFFLGFFTFIALLEGINCDRLSFNGLKIEKLYLKWENGLLIRASKVDLSAFKRDNLPLTLKPLGKLPPLIRHTQRWVKQIDIDTIQYESIRLSLHYRENSLGKITLYDENGSYNGTFSLNENLFKLSLPHARLNGALISGNLTVELPQQRLHTNISLNLPQTPPLIIKASGDTDSLMFALHTDEPLRSVQPIIDFLDVDPEVQPWITHYAKASLITLERFEGKFHYDKPEELIKGLQAKATIFNGEYTFAQGFEPIKSPRIDLYYRVGKLHILPKSGTFYALPTENSSVILDFTTPHTMLDAQIRTAHAKLNVPITNLLNFYDIHLPIQQSSGECDVDLNLSINLHSLDTVVKGIFRPTASELLLDQIPLKTQGGVVNVNRNKVTFDNFTAHYGEDVAHARVKGEYDASSEEGSVSIDAYDIVPLGNKKQLSLWDSREPLRVKYIIAPKGDSLSIMPSRWNVLGEKLDIEAFRAPFDYRNATSSLQSVPFSLSNTIHGKINGYFNGSKKQTDIQIELNDFKLGEIQLTHAPFNIDIHYDHNHSTLRSSHASAWSIHQLPLLLSPFHASMDGNEIAFEQIEAVLGDLLKGKFTGHLSLDTLKGSIRINDMIPLSPKISPLVDAQESLQLSLDASGEEIILDSDALKAHFSTIPNGWKITLDDIALLSMRSPILRQYHVEKGNLNLFYTPENSQYTFNGTIEYPYSLMMINDKAVSKYHFSGLYQDGRTSIRVNDRLIINRRDDQIDVQAKNIGINVPQLFSFLIANQPNQESSSKGDSQTPPIRIHTSNTYLYLMKGRKIVADRMEATLNNDDLDASLYHMGGSAALKIRNGLFYIDGNGFNDKFMEHLFALSDFSGGKFSFQAKGEADAFEGVMRVENTILKDYKVLNNVLAFVNTVPSLATFSLPSYNRQGLPVKEGYAHFAYNKGIVNVDNFTLNSPEMNILGEGRADLNAQILNGTLTLKTDLGSVLGKVPMVGYILFGEDGSLSTTLTLSGKLDDPKVETAIAKEIATAPFNILKRTVVYPFLWMMDDKKKK